MFALFSGLKDLYETKTTRKGSILFLGLDGAGKTTLIEALLSNIHPKRKPKNILPTNGFNVETIKNSDVAINIWEVSGKQHFRSIWNDYLHDATALIYVINGKQESRLSETQSLLNDISGYFLKPISLVFIDSTYLFIQKFGYEYKIFPVDFAKKGDIMRLHLWIESTLI